MGVGISEPMVRVSLSLTIESYDDFLLSYVPPDIVTVASIGEVLGFLTVIHSAPFDNLPDR